MQGWQDSTDKTSVPAHLERIQDFVDGSPGLGLHEVDLPYRLCSPAAQDPANARLWQDDSGRVLGYGLINLPFASIDHAFLPEDGRQGEFGGAYFSGAYFGAMMAWANLRLAELAAQRGSEMGFLVGLREDDPRAGLLENYGFVDDQWSMRHMLIEPAASLARPLCPEGIILRPLTGPDEAQIYVDTHRAAFGSTNMTLDWKLRVMQHPRYRPDLDLGAFTLDGRMAAFCVGWLAEVGGQVQGQIEPLGVLPEFQKMGIGRAILLETLQRMRSRGAQQLWIEAESYNEGSQHLYEGVGFADAYRAPRYFRQYEA
jgi:mycothiol synthase